MQSPLYQSMEIIKIQIISAAFLRLPSRKDLLPRGHSKSIMMTSMKVHIVIKAIKRKVIITDMYQILLSKLHLI